MTPYDQLRRRKILLVDADPWIRDSLSLLLACEKCRVTALDNAADGLRAVEGEGFDIIICGDGDPGIDGVAFLERAGRIRPEAVRILIAGYPVGEIAAVAAQAGIHRCLPKPFTRDTLEEILRGLTWMHLPEQEGGASKTDGKTDVQSG